MADIPSPLTWGTIVGNFGALNADSNDAGQAPDLEPVGGQVTITPRIPLVKILDPAVPMIAVNKTIQCNIVNGILIGPDGQPGVRVVATNSPGIEPYPLQWEVRIVITGATTQPAPMVINVPGGQTVNLAVVVPVSPAPPTVTVVSEQTKLDAIAARNAAQLAETNAETAETNAETAEAAAKVARTGAETARTDAETARTGAQTARTGAETARTQAQTAETNAKAAQTAAETARGQAQTAQVATEEALELAEQRALGNYTNGARVVVDGDSIAIGGISNNVSGTGNQDRATAWPSFMLGASDGRLDLLSVAAVGGQRSDAMLSRFDANVAPLNPDVVIATIGTNDMGQSIPMATWLANIEAYRQKCIDIGATLVIGEIYPTSNNTPAGRPAAVETWNTALRDWAKNNGIRVIPFSNFTDPATKGWPTGWSSDAIHPTLLDSREQIGVFVWQTISDLFDGQVTRPARTFGTGVLNNGLFTAKTAPLSPPTVSTVSSTASGALPTGSYSYRATTRNYMGESALSVPSVATLASPGNITVSWPGVVGTRGYFLYRRGPNDLDWLYVGEFSANGGATTTWVDNGSVVPGARATGIDQSAMPTELSWGTGTAQKIGGGVLSDSTVKGNFIRMLPLTTEAISTALPTPAGTATQGQVWEMSGLVRGDGQNTATVYARLRLGTTTVAQVRAYDGYPLPGMQWARFHLRVTIPSGVDNLIPLISCNAGNGYVDFAELRLAKIEG